MCSLVKLAVAVDALWLQDAVLAEELVLFENPEALVLLNDGDTARQNNKPVLQHMAATDQTGISRPKFRMHATISDNTAKWLTKHMARTYRRLADPRR